VKVVGLRTGRGKLLAKGLASEAPMGLRSAAGPRPEQRTHAATGLPPQALGHVLRDPSASTQ